MRGQEEADVRYCRQEGTGLHYCGQDGCTLLRWTSAWQQDQDALLQAACMEEREGQVRVRLVAVDMQTSVLGWYRFNPGWLRHGRRAAAVRFSRSHRARCWAGVWDVGSRGVIGCSGRVRHVNNLAPD